MSIEVHAVGRDDPPPFIMPDRFHRDVAYFMTPAGESGVAELQANEFWVRLEEAKMWLEDGVLLLISPLDSSQKAEVEISDDQEAWLQWMVQNEIQHIRLTRPGGKPWTG
jgi:hypothetical protein